MSTPSENASGSSTPKAIPSLTRRSQDTTRQGSQKLKFVPVNPVRRQKEEVKNEPPPERTLPSESNYDRGESRDRGRGDGRGRGRGAPRPPIEMTASGPFALGPAMAGNNVRRSVPKSNFTNPAPSTSSKPDLGAGLSNTPAPSIKTEDRKGKQMIIDEEEVYSDQEDGVEIVDIEKIQDMDWMAPESLRKEKPVVKTKKEDSDGTPETGDVNLSNAVDLSESEDEEELEDIIDDFNQQIDLDTDPTPRQDKLYCFQFPSPFPVFQSTNANVQVPSPTKKVTFAPSAKSEPSSSSVPPDFPEKEPVPPPVDGLIGRLEVYRSGIVKMKLANGIVLDVTAATQPSFLQHAVHVDLEEKSMSVLGEVNKRFAVAPDVDVLLNAMQTFDARPSLLEGEENLIKMDDT
ncbi:hypothetical protein K435DRAFT_720095 [Dendrothele bispora CBS 962.96]|uniref:RNA polymerase III RPC4-domain-containing protein n=1 Tax=Dendrothele bispora (strain CBS 962.96) TaxID=1314807 RepID=A0A4S8MB19_DENBC|nr:hypothetical protein K435DRAFT_720095 [Dendrothele bispora CBS 962.96]